MLYWLASGHSRLSAVAARAIRDADHLFASATSAVEVAMNHHKGRLVLPTDPATWYRRLLRLYHVRSKPVTSAIGFRSVALPPHHNDPFDRLIVATAVEHGCRLVTPDRHIAKYEDVSVVW